MTGETKPGDPADRAADGAFGGVTTHSHRAGYGDDRLGRLIDYLRRNPSATLASGEGALLLAEIARLRDQLYLADQSARSSSAEAARLGRILAALREPSEAVVMGAHQQLRGLVPGYLVPVIPAAVAAAEQEVGRE